jgi:predicted  nucleic acid-binding Zn-ribbon protein
MKDRQEEKVERPFQELDHIKTLKRQCGNKIVSIENTEIVILLDRPRLLYLEEGSASTFSLDHVSQNALSVIFLNHSKYHSKLNVRIKIGYLDDSFLLETIIGYIHYFYTVDATLDRLLRVETPESQFSEKLKRPLAKLNTLACERNARKRFKGLLKEEKVNNSSSILSVCFTALDIPSFEGGNHWSMLEYKDRTTDPYAVINSIDPDRVFVFIFDKLKHIMPVHPKEEKVKDLSLPQVLKILYPTSPEIFMWSPKVGKFKPLKETTFESVKERVSEIKQQIAALQLEKVKFSEEISEAGTGIAMATHLQEIVQKAIETAALPKPESEDEKNILSSTRILAIWEKMKAGHLGLSSSVSNQHTVKLREELEELNKKIKKSDETIKGLQEELEQQQKIVEESKPCLSSAIAATVHAHKGHKRNVSHPNAPLMSSTVQIKK